MRKVSADLLNHVDRPLLKNDEKSAKSIISKRKKQNLESLLNVKLVIHAEYFFHLMANYDIFSRVLASIFFLTYNYYPGVFSVHKLVSLYVHDP